MKKKITENDLSLGGLDLSDFNIFDDDSLKGMKKQADKRRGAGRPTKYDPRMVKEGERLAGLGLTTEEMADFWGVTRETVNQWRGKYPGFAKAMDSGRITADSSVVDSLYREAMNGNVTACIFWLKNRVPDRWKDKREEKVEHIGPPVWTETRIVAEPDEKA